MPQFYHSVTLDRDKCTGCTNCIRVCPMEAMRVHDGKAYVIANRCIDCGECVRKCPYHAIKFKCDELIDRTQYKYTIAIADASLYGQFNHLEDVNYILTGLKKLGFDDVYDATEAGEIISELTRKLIATGKHIKPLISSSCPVITRIIRVRFAEQCENVLPLLSPAELAAKIARQKAIEKTGYSSQEIGIFFISPCPAKATAIHMPLGSIKSNIDKVIAIKELYPRLLSAMNTIKEPEILSTTSSYGFAYNGGESAALHIDNTITTDGIGNVVKILEAIENGSITDIDFVELNSCAGGCVGGILNIENPYVAASHIKKIEKTLPKSKGNQELPVDANWDDPLEHTPILKLDEDLGTAMVKHNEIEAILKKLPGIDCGSCGAPSCHALAEDIVRGLAHEGDCIFRMRKQLHEIFKKNGSIPQVLRKENLENK